MTNVSLTYKIKLALSVFLSSILFYGCDNKRNVPVTSGQDIFDLVKFTQGEIKQYENRECNIYKEGTINHESGQNTLSANEFDWEREFKVLTDMNINKSSWVDDFNVDTIHTNSEDFGDISIVSYLNKNEKTPIKKLEITFPYDNYKYPLFITAERHTKNWIFSSEQTVRYSVGNALQAEGKLKTLWLKEKEFIITSIYKCRDEQN
ncbi:MAG TPA: hypothetical protein VFD65_02405 [Chitinophagales bacterium]|nr:hypothetical protein [Chitinophagales bacterium]